MLRTHLTRLAVAVGLVVVAAQAARANFYLDVTYASGGAAGSTPYQANVDASDETITLNVAVLITDPTAASSANDGWKSGNANFYVGSGTLLGDVLTNNTFNGNVGTHTAGAAFTDVFGTMGLGGSVASNNNAVGQWWGITTTAFPSFVFGGTPYVLSGNTVGIEYPVGTISVSFAGHALPQATTTAPLISIAANKIGTSKAFNWVDSSGTQTVFGTASNVGQGIGSGGTANNGTIASSNNLIYNLNGAGLNFVFTGGTVTTNPAALSASLAISGATAQLSGNNFPLAGTVTNSGVPTANTLDWNQSTTAGAASVTPSGGSIGSGGSISVSGSLPGLPSGTFGVINSTVTFTGTDATTSAILPNVVKNLVAISIGNAATGGADGTGIPGDSYGPLLRTPGTVTSLAGLTTSLGTAANSFGIGKTTATILAGNLSTANTVTMEWRSRASQELPANATALGGPAAGFFPLYGDVVNLNGISGGTANAYVLQMTYDPATLGGPAAAASAASRGFLFLGYRQANGQWANAVNGNDTTGAAADPNWQGSYASFATSTAGGNGFTLAQTLGTWGVDTANNDVWAVVDHDAEFAPVPEPGTIALLIGGIAALGFAYRRRKANKA